jgi:transcription-repair coupling factor (superfamily II helicase)
LPLPAFIPEEYVADVETRLSLYQSLARLNRIDQIEAMADELNDRFGAMPVEVQNLLYAVKIKLLAAKAGIESVTVEDKQIVIRLLAGMHFTPEQRALPLPEGVKMGVSQIRLSYRSMRGWKEVLEGVVKGV